MISLKRMQPIAQLLILFGLFIFGGSVLVILMKLEVLSAFGIHLSHPQNTNDYRALSVVGTAIAFLLPALLFARLYDHPAMNKIGFRASRVQNLLLAVLLIAFSLPLVNALSIINKGIHLPAFLKDFEDALIRSSAEYQQQISTIIDMPNVFSLGANLVVMAFLPALAEELFFRGCMQQIFQQWFKRYLIAVIASAIVFSILHFDFYGFLPRVALGMILGWLFAKTGSLLPGILAHFFNNAMALVVTYIGQHAANKKDYATEDFNIPMWTALISLVVVIYFITRLKRDHGFAYPSKNDPPTIDNI